MFQNLLGKAKGLLGVGGSAGAAGDAGLSREDQQAQKIFVDRFVSRGINALNVALKQGLVDPAKVSGPATTAAAGSTSGAAAPAAPAAPAGSAPAAPGAAAPAASPAAQAGKAKPATSAAAAKNAPGNAAVPTGQKQAAVKPQVDANVDKIVSGMRKLVPAGTRPLPPDSKIAKEILADLPKVSLNKDYLIRVGDKILKLDNAGYNVKDLHTQFMGQYAKGAKQKTIAEGRLEEIYSKLQEEYFREALKKAGHDPLLVTKKIEQLLAKHRAQRAEKQEKEEKMGLQELNPQAPASNSAKPGIGEWFQKNFMNNFLRGIDISSAKTEVDAILNRMPQSYKQGTLKNDLNDLAMIAWTLSDQGKGKDKDTN